MDKYPKQKKKKTNSKNNSNHSSSNNSNTSDENKNSLNNSANEAKDKNIIHTSQQGNIPKNEQGQQNNNKLNQLLNLKYVFPFSSQQKEAENKINDYSISEYNKIVCSINNKSNKTKMSEKNNYEEDILEGKVNIIDKIIQKYMPSSNDNKVIQIHQGLTSLSLKIDKNFNMLTISDIVYPI